MPGGSVSALTGTDGGSYSAGRGIVGTSTGRGGIPVVKVTFRIGRGVSINHHGLVVAGRGVSGAPGASIGSFEGEIGTEVGV